VEKRQAENKKNENLKPEVFIDGGISVYRRRNTLKEVTATSTIKSHG
jgi:hypothetical protein